MIRPVSRLRHGFDSRHRDDPTDDGIRPPGPLAAIALPPVNKVKTHLQALSLLDRAFVALTDAELEALFASLPEDHQKAIDELSGSTDGFADADTRNLAMRTAVTRGRMNGELEKITTVLTDPSLAECIETLGENADFPTEAQILEVTPALIEKYGLGTVRLMLAGAIAGEAKAAPTLTYLLKHDETLALPKVEIESAPALPARKADDDVKAKRKAVQEQRKVDSRNRREQQARARNRV